jgi:hypothetical protein
MIIVRLIGGLGNQMFQYALGRRLAAERNVPLKLDIAWYQEHTLRSYQLDRFQISSQVATPQEVECVTKSHWRGLPGRFYQAIQRRLPYHRRAVVREVASSFDLSILKVSKSAYLIGYWQDEAYFKPVELPLRQEFMLKHPFSPGSAVWASKIQACNSVSVHVRRGDYVSDSNIFQKFGLCGVEYYLKAFEYISAHDSGFTFFVFSDDLDWARQNLGFFSPAEFVRVEGRTQDEEEMILMSLCRYHIIANSSYSWWGAWLGKGDGNMVIAPKKWFNTKEIDRTNLPLADWILI